MHYFRLTFTPKSTTIERRLKNGRYQVIEIHPERFDYDAKLLDDLLSDLSGQPKATGPAFEVR